MSARILPNVAMSSVALDLTVLYPRSPQAILGSHILAARVTDKCRALLNRTLGLYKSNGTLDQIFFIFYWH